MISVKEAAVTAAEFAKALATDEPMSRWGRDVQLEEVEQGTVSGREVWLITLSVLKTAPLAGLNGDREYKVFAVDRSSGDVLSMKIREFAGAHD